MFCAIQSSTASNLSPTDYKPIRTAITGEPDNAACQVIRKEITVESFATDLEDFVQERSRQTYQVLRKPIAPARKAPWQAKWRILQQRPRDGLRS